MNIFFFGSTSFVSQDLIKKLDKKFDIYCTSRKNSKKKNIYQFDLNRKNKDFYDKIKNIDYLFFFASLVPIKESKSTWEDCRKTNVHGLINLLKNIKLPIKKIILASSCSLYGQKKSFFNEKSFLKPSSGYALSKLTQEKILKVFCLKNNIKFLAYRLGYVYGNNMNKKRIKVSFFLQFNTQKQQNNGVNYLQGWVGRVRCTGNGQNAVNQMDISVARKDVAWFRVDGGLVVV